MIFNKVTFISGLVVYYLILKASHTPQRGHTSLTILVKSVRFPFGYKAMLLQANHPKAFPSQRMLTTGESGRLVRLSVCVTFLFNSLPNFHVVQKTFQISQVWQCLGFVQLIQDQKTIIKLHKVPQHTFVWDFSHDLHNTTLNSILALAVLVCIIVVVVLLLTAELLPVTLEAVESVLERVALLALHPRVQDQAAILKITFTLCYTHYRVTYSLLVQAQSVTVTPLGQGKSVTLSNCHCKQRSFITKPINWDMGKVSL